MKRNTWITLVAASVLGVGLLAWAFAPRPVEVEAVAATQGPFETAVEEDGRTRVSERYAVVAPIAGRLRRIALREGDAVQAGQALALPLDPRLTLAARLNLAAQRREEGQVAEAVALAREATEIAPELAHGWLHLGLGLRRGGDLAQAIGAYRQALALEPTRSEAHQNLAVALLLVGDVLGARQHFRAAIGHLVAQGRQDEAEALRGRAAALVKLEP